MTDRADEIADDLRLRKFCPHAETAPLRGARRIRASECTLCIAAALRLYARDWLERAWKKVNGTNVVVTEHTSAYDAAVGHLVRARDAVVALADELGQPEGAAGKHQGPWNIANAKWVKKL